MAPTIGDPVPTPRVKRERPRDPQAMEAVDALLQSPEGTSVPVRGFMDEDDARRFGGRVQGYAQRDYDLHVRTNYSRDTETLFLTIESEERDEEGVPRTEDGEGEENDPGEHPSFGRRDE